MTESPENRPVGYKSPPKASRFKPGESGNPAGRPKSIPSLQSALLAELSEPAALKGADGQVMTKQSALVRKLVAEAVAGNMRAVGLLVTILARKSDAAGDDGTAAAEDRDIIDSFVEREVKRRRGAAETASS